MLNGIRHSRASAFIGGGFRLRVIHGLRCRYQGTPLPFFVTRDVRFFGGIRLLGTLLGRLLEDYLEVTE